MKVQVIQENLNRALQNVASVAVGARGQLPILSNILIKTDGNQLSLSATNLEIAITELIGAKVSSQGTITIPARILREYIASLSKGKVNLELEGRKLKITNEHHNSQVNGVSSEEFPVIPTIKTEPIWKVSSVILKKALNQVVFSASSDNARPILTGVYFHQSGGDIFLAATDSYRLSEKKIGKTKQPISLLIPASTLNDLQRVLGDEIEEVSIYVEGQQVMFKFDNIELISRLIEGDYPDYRKLLPTKFDTTAKLDKTEFISATKLASLFAKENAGSITIEVSSTKKQVEIKSGASQVGENSTALPAEIKGDGQVALNSRFLNDGLQSLDGNVIEFKMNGKLEPCLLYSDKDKDYMHVIMPLKS